MDEGLTRGLMANADCERKGKRHATTDGSVKLVLKMLPVEDLLVRVPFLSPSGSRVNVSPLRGDVC